MRTITKKRFEFIKKTGWYKARLGKAVHLCSVYSVTGDKTAPLWKRILSHVYVIVFFKVEE